MFTSSVLIIRGCVIKLEVKMRNLLLEEYEEKLAKVARIFEATKCKGDTAQWKNPIDDTSVYVELRIVGSQDRHMEPKLKVGSSAALPADGFAAMVQLQSNLNMFQKAAEAIVALGDVFVWYEEAPCDYCGGMGTANHHAGGECPTCKGAGVRKSKESE
jgi:hypothetical protein